MEAKAPGYVVTLNRNFNSAQTFLLVPPGAVRDDADGKCDDDADGNVPYAPANRTFISRKQCTSWVF